ncbi:MAG: SRPBCC family protein [Microthrixaceae bacterium]
MTITKTAEAVLDASPGAVFGTLTDIAHLPEWNDAIVRVVEPLPALEPGAEWVVEVRALGQRWNSRSRITAVDPGEGRFHYRSCTDDGNPSYALWAWTVNPDPAGSRVAVSMELHPATFWRRVLLARIRARQVGRTELPSSLAALGAAAKARSSSDTSSS